MKKVAIGLVVFVAALFLIRLPEYFTAKHSESLGVTWSSINIAALQLKQDGRFTNSYPNICHLFVYTNHYSISGMDYQCVVAADSWDYRSRSNLLAFTTNAFACSLIVTER
jgi:hypothetical protein